jgi:ADP-heptose:LPS heptosyltransferase
MTWITGIPIRIGTGYRWYSFLFNRKVYEHRKDAQRHELEYNLNLLQAIGCSVSHEAIVPRLKIHPSAADKVSRVLEDKGIRESDQIVILHPGSGGSARDWAPGNFGELARRLETLPGVRVIITGGKGEHEIVSHVHSFVPRLGIAIVDSLSLSEYAALCRMALRFEFYRNHSYCSRRRDSGHWIVSSADSVECCPVGTIY